MEVIKNGNKKTFFRAYIKHFTIVDFISQNLPSPIGSLVKEFKVHEVITFQSAARRIPLIDSNFFALFSAIVSRDDRRQNGRHTLNLIKWAQRQAA
jgi:hypothetical protein